MLLIFLIALYFLKVYTLGNYLGIENPDSYLIIANSDAYILLIALSLYFFKNSHSYIIGTVTRLILNLTVLAYLIDLLCISQLNQRLYLSDIIKYASDIGAVVNIQISILLVGLILFFILANRLDFPALRIKPAVIIFILILAFIQISNTDINSSPRSIYLYNFIQANINNSSHQSYSNKFIENLSIPNMNRCSINESPTPENIYIFLVESWSNYHSKYFGGNKNWTPRLDNIAKKNVSFHSFYANGYTTEFGLLATIFSYPPIPYQQSIGLTGQLSLDSFAPNKHHLFTLQNQGYEAYFITSGDLNFQDKESWLKNTGFNRLISAKDFIQKQRFVFDSVEDEVLFAKVLDVSTETTDSNKLVIVENVTTHPPFITPTDSGAISSEKAAFEYLDIHLSNAIEQLNNGRNLIIVMSDHRVMSPLTHNERKHSGHMAPSHIPAFLIWNGENIQHDHGFQQSDILSSIADLVSGKSCYSRIKGAIFPISDPKPAQCVLFTRGDNRNLVSAKCGTEVIDVLLDGDNTRIVNNNDPERWSFLIEEINYLRLSQASRLK